MTGPRKLGVVVHIAVIEWPEDEIDPAIHASIDREALESDIRADVEALAQEFAEYDEWAEWVMRNVGNRKLGFRAWYEELHEYDQSPWVTFSEKEI